MVVVLALKGNAKSPGAISECKLSTLQGIAYNLANKGLIEATRLICNRWQALSRRRCNVSYDNLVSISIYDEVRIVVDHDNLAFASGLLKQGDELIVNGFWIKVFFWLVDNQRSDVIIIECKLE